MFRKVAATIASLLEYRAMAGVGRNNAEVWLHRPDEAPSVHRSLSRVGEMDGAQLAAWVFSSGSPNWPARSAVATRNLRALAPLTSLRFATIQIFAIGAPVARQSGEAFPQNLAPLGLSLIRHQGQTQKVMVLLRL